MKHILTQKEKQEINLIMRKYIANYKEQLLANIHEEVTEEFEERIVGREHITNGAMSFENAIWREVELQFSRIDYKIIESLQIAGKNFKV